MSVVDKAIAAITPPESESARAEATSKAQAAAQPGDWLSLVLEHHRLLRSAMTAAIDAAPSQRAAKMKDMAIILAGHAQAEEIVLYPALAKAKEKGHADMGYTEQVAVKMQMAELERLDPASQDWLDKLEHIQGAVLHHMFEEEGTWFLELKEQGGDQSKVTQRYKEEYDRYVS